MVFMAVASSLSLATPAGTLLSPKIISLGKLGGIRSPPGLDRQDSNSDVRAALSARHLPLKSGNFDDQKQPVAISGNPSKPPNDNIKTKLKNNSTPTTQEACGRASITSQILKGINQLQ